MSSIIKAGIERALKESKTQFSHGNALGGQPQILGINGDLLYQRVSGIMSVWEPEESELAVFEKRVQEIRASKGYRLEITFNGIWSIAVYNRDTGEHLASTGTSTLSILPELLEMPLDQAPWGK